MIARLKIAITISCRSSASIKYIYVIRADIASIKSNCRIWNGIIFFCGKRGRRDKKNFLLKNTYVEVEFPFHRIFQAYNF